MEGVGMNNKERIRQKQARAEERNRLRRFKHDERTGQVVFPREGDIYGKTSTSK